MTGNKNNWEGKSSDNGEPDPGPYWQRMHYDWRFWVGATLMAAAIAIYVLREISPGFHEDYPGESVVWPRESSHAT